MRPGIVGRGVTWLVLCVGHYVKVATLTLLGGGDKSATSKFSERSCQQISLQPVVCEKPQDPVKVVQLLTGAKRIKHSTTRCEVNMTKKYTVPSLTILSRIVRVPGGPKPRDLRPTQMMIRNTRRSVNGRFFPNRREDDTG